MQMAIDNLEIEFLLLQIHLELQQQHTNFLLILPKLLDFVKFILLTLDYLIMTNFIQNQILFFDKAFKEFENFKQSFQKY